MDDSDRELDELLEAPEPPPVAFPVVGESIVPTAEDIAQGRFGNGAWDFRGDDVQRAYMEVHQQKTADRDERRKFFHESAKDALADAVKLHHSIISRGLDIMARINEPDEDRPITRYDMQILSMAQKSSKELTDRANGRAATASSDESTSSSLLQIIERRDPNG